LWEFPDLLKVSIKEVDNHDDVFDMKEIREGVQKITSKSGKAKSDSIWAWVKQIEKNKLLHCSEPGVKKGTVEELAAIGISCIARVSIPAPSTANPDE
jgi:hypothetical protein